MPTRKIRDLGPQETCTHNKHNPPNHRVFTPGVYEHICPACGKRTEFTIRSLKWEHRESCQQNDAAKILGRNGGLKGGPARAEKLSPERRSEIARKAATARWSKSVGR